MVKTPPKSGQASRIGRQAISHFIAFDYEHSSSHQAPSRRNDPFSSYSLTSHIRLLATPVFVGRQIVADVL